MALDFSLKLAEVLKEIDFLEHLQWEIHNPNEERTDNSLENYGKAKWEIVEMLNECYAHLLESKFDHYNWLNHDPNDEVAYFLNEAGSNSLNHSEYKTPANFHLWIGKKGFIIGIEQKGKSFNAKEINEKRIKDNEGAAFNFFRSCQSQIFFDEAERSKVVYLKHNFKRSKN